MVHGTLYDMRRAPSPLLVELRDRVHQRGPAGLDLLDGPLQGRRDLLGVLDGAFGVPAQGAGETRKIRRRVIDACPVEAFSTGRPRCSEIRIWCSQSL